MNYNEVNDTDIFLRNDVSFTAKSVKFSQQIFCLYDIKSIEGDLYCNMHCQVVRSQVQAMLQALTELSHSRLLAHLHLTPSSWDS